MTLNEFGRFLNTKSIGRVESPVNEQLTERVFSAMKKIAFDTTPLRWTINKRAGEDIIRRIDLNTYIRTPHKPIIDSGEQLDIESELVDALALYVMAGLEPQRSKVNMGMYYAEIENYNVKLIETSLQEATNDSPKFHQFP
jgi:hypothetical protein